MTFRSYPNRARARRHALKQIGYVIPGRVLQEDILHPYTPQAHGAVGDGVHDDTAAVQAALDRGWTHFPTGTYMVTGPITLSAA